MPTNASSLGLFAATALALAGAAPSASAQDEGRDNRLKREILQEVDRRIARQLDALRQDIRRMLAQHAPPHAAAPQAPPAPHAPQAPRVRVERRVERRESDRPEGDRGEQLRRLAEQMRARAERSRRAMPGAQRDQRHDQRRAHDAHRCEVRVTSADGRATVRIECDGRVIERELRTDRPQSIDVPVPGGKVTIRVDGEGRVSVQSAVGAHGAARDDAREGGPHDARPPQGGLRRLRLFGQPFGEDGPRAFEFRFEGNPDDAPRELEEWAQRFGKLLQPPHGTLRLRPMEPGAHEPRGEGRELRELEEALPRLGQQLERLLRELEGELGEGRHADRPRPERPARPQHRAPQRPRRDREGSF